MKTALLFLLLLPLIGNGQMAILKNGEVFLDTKLYVEVKDTTETAYFHYYGDNWIHRDAFSITREEKKDSIGVNKVRITRLYYYTNEFMKGGKTYLDINLKKYLGKRIGNFQPEETAQ